MDKSSLRKTLRAERKKLSIAHREDAAMQIAEHFKASSIFATAERIACYFASGYEVATDAIIKTIWSQNKKCYLPVLCDESQGQLQFILYTPQMEVTLNKHNIYEPKVDKGNLKLELLDIVLMPLLAFDQSGTRLGSGGGYYDRTFHSIKQSNPKHPLLIGLAYEEQMVEEPLPRDKWDVLLDGVITSKGLQLFGVS